MTNKPEGDGGALSLPDDPDGDGYRRVGVAVLRKALGDLDLVGLDAHDRWSAARVLDGTSPESRFWSGVCGIEPAALARMVSRLKGAPARQAGAGAPTEGRVEPGQGGEPRRGENRRGGDLPHDGDERGADRTQRPGRLR